MGPNLVIDSKLNNLEEIFTEYADSHTDYGNYSSIRNSFQYENLCSSVSFAKEEKLKIDLCISN